MVVKFRYVFFYRSYLKNFRIHALVNLMKYRIFNFLYQVPRRHYLLATQSFIVKVTTTYYLVAILFLLKTFRLYQLN